MSGELGALNSGAWDLLGKKLRHCSLFLDEASAELLHWNAGLRRLLDAGVKAAKPLHPNQAAEEGCGKAAFVVSGVLDRPNVGKWIAAVIANSPHLDYVVLVTSASHRTHLIGRNGWKESSGMETLSGRPIFDKYEGFLLEALGNFNFTAEVMCVPLHLACPVDGLFLTLPFAGLVPPLRAEDFHSDFERLLPETREGVAGLIGAVEWVLGGLGARDEIFAVGPFAAIVATQLASRAETKSRRKNGSRKTSLIFVDRGVDIVEALKCSATSALDPILFSSAVAPGHSVERLVGLDCGDLPGCLFHDACPLFPATIDLPAKDAEAQALALLRQAVGEQDGDLDQLLQSAWSSDKVWEEHCGLLELATALRAPISADHQRWAKLVKRCRLSTFSLAKLEKLITMEKLSCLEELLCMATMWGSHPEKLGTAESWDAYVGELAERLEKSAALPDFLRPKYGRADEVAWRRLATAAFAVSQSLARIRRVVGLGRTAPAVPEIAKFGLSGRLGDCDDIVAKSGGLGEALRSGFGLGSMLSSALIGSEAESDAVPLTIVFVLGGVTTSEVAAVRRLQKESDGTAEILLGSTSLVSARDVMRSCFSGLI